jgi:murein DD-endopeptidase MepM/ murein hydrolase activator NlpD
VTREVAPQNTRVAKRVYARTRSFPESEVLPTAVVHNQWSCPHVDHRRWRRNGADGDAGGMRNTCLLLATALAMLLAAPSAPARVAARFSWPLTSPHPVLRRFEPPSRPFGPGHRGVDLGGVAGQPVLAAGDGVVRYAGPLVDRPVISIEHAGGLRTTYEPVLPTVRPGQQVSRGQLVGRLQPGHPGCLAVCLHWGAHRGTEYLDPLRLVSTGGVRLLPWRDP